MDPYTPNPAPRDPHDEPRPAVRTAAIPRPAQNARWIALLLLPLLLALLPLGRAQEGVTVQGEGVVYAEPDQAVIELGVTASDPDVRVALDTANERMEAVREALLAAGVTEEDLRTSAFHLWHEDSYDREGNPGEPVYRVSHLYTVTVRTPDAVGRVLVDAVEAGANQIGGVSFGMADPTSLESAARQRAVEDARRKAEGLASAVGATLGAPLSIQEGGGYQPPQPVAFERMSVAADAAPVEAGQLAVRVVVTVRYALAGGAGGGGGGAE